MKYANVVEIRVEGKIIQEIRGGKKGKGKLLHSITCNDERNNYELEVADKNITQWLKEHWYVPVFHSEWGMCRINYYRWKRVIV